MALDPRVNLPPELYTVRSNLVQAIIAALAATDYMTPHVDNVDIALQYDGVKLFEFVSQGVLDDITQSQTPAARVEEGDEELQELMWPLSQKSFRLYVHFKVVAVVGVDPTAMINYYFGRIVETLVTAEHFAGIALDITEAGNSIQAQGANDPEPGGTIWFTVEYRHGHGNYFSETGNE